MKKANSSKWDKQSVLYCHEYTRAIIVRSNSLRGTWSLLSEIWSQCWKHEFEYNIFCHWKPQTAILSRSTRWAVNMRRVYWKKVWKSTQEAKKNLCISGWSFEIYPKLLNSLHIHLTRNPYISTNQKKENIFSYFEWEGEKVGRRRESTLELIGSELLTIRSK